MRPQIRRTDPLLAEVARAVVEAGPDGTTWPDVTAKLGIGLDRCARYCKAARDFGLIAKYGVRSQPSRLMAPKYWDAFVLAARIRERQNKRTKERLKREEAERAPVVEHDDAADWPIEIRRVKAGEVPPPVTSAANCVFVWRPAA